MKHLETAFGINECNFCRTRLKFKSKVSFHQRQKVKNLKKNSFCAAFKKKLKVSELQFEIYFFICKSTYKHILYDITLRECSTAAQKKTIKW